MKSDHSRKPHRALWLLPAGVILLSTAPLSAQRMVDTPPADGQRSTAPVQTAASSNRSQSLGVVYVKRGNVVIRTGPGRTDPVAATVREGDELAVLERETVRLKVQTSGGETGYIASLNVTDVPPRSSSGRQVVLRNDTGPAERTSVTAIRGLHPVAEEYATENEIPAEVVEDVKRMEENGKNITGAELDSFASEGGVELP